MLVVAPSCLSDKLNHINSMTKDRGKRKRVESGWERQRKSDEKKQALAAKKYSQDLKSMFAKKKESQTNCSRNVSISNSLHPGTSDTAVSTEPTYLYFRHQLSPTLTPSHSTLSLTPLIYKPTFIFNSR